MTFDPIIIGETIKQLLKTHNMTQDQLANHLHITKSAVSQNLNGKSSFDIQNLIAIAKLFNISLDDLLGLKKEEKRLPSPYETLLEKGLEGINHVPPKQLQLGKPDIYGLVYIEYVLKSDHMVLLNYLLSHDIIYVDPNYHRAAEITLKVLLYMMEYKVEGYQKEFERYVTLKDGLFFDDTISESIFYGLLEDPFFDAFRTYFIKLLQEDLKINLLKSKPKKLKLSLESLMDLIATHKLHKLGLLLIKHFDFEPHIFYFIKACVKHHDFKSIEILLDETYQVKPNSFKISLYNLEETTKLIMTLKDEALIKRALDKHLYQDITTIFNYSSELSLEETLHYILHTFKDTLILRRIIYSNLMNYPNILDSLFDTLKQEDKDYIITKAKPSDLEFILYAFHKGARFQFESVDQNTFKSINLLIETLIKGDKS